ncbi:MAG: glycosyltransferase family 2 protein [Verrucomicrobia bacterium]|nr:glycosyltransferase family 2 protein [Verrucomicrobiota bacterium]
MTSPTSSAQPAVFILVLNWNNGPDTLDCLASLAQLAYANFRVVVIDNGSSDESLNDIRQAYPDVTTLSNPTNLGFAEGNNVGIRHALDAGADFVLLLNNDTTVDPDLLNALVTAHATVDRPGFLGAKIFYHGDPNRIWMGRPVWQAESGCFEHVGLNAIDAAPAESRVEEMAYACGCALFVSADTVRHVGMMDPRFFCYYEEVDWCFRAAALGYRHYYVPAAKVWHKVSATSGGNQSPVVRYFRTRNALLWARRNLSRRDRRKVFRHLARHTFDGFGWRETGPIASVKRIYWNLLTIQRDPLIKAWRRGVWDYWRGRFGPCPEAVRKW